MALKYLKRVSRLIPDTRISPKNVLRETMRINYTQQKEICSAFIDGIKKINPKDPALKFWYKELTECQNRAIDCAHKLAPYEHPKLESMEVKQTIEHRMVMRAPQKILDVDQWAKLTGATVAKLEDLQKRETTFAPRTESLHDFDEDESEDEINTQRQLN